MNRSCHCISVELRFRTLIRIPPNLFCNSVSSETPRGGDILYFSLVWASNQWPMNRYSLSAGSWPPSSWCSYCGMPFYTKCNGAHASHKVPLLTHQLTELHNQCVTNEKWAVGGCGKLAPCVWFTTVVRFVREKMMAAHLWWFTGIQEPQNI